MPEQQEILPSGGCLPGIPGDHAPGVYLVDYEARTIRPYVEQTDTNTTQPLVEQVPPEQPAEL